MEVTFIQKSQSVEKFERLKRYLTAFGIPWTLTSETSIQATVGLDRAMTLADAYDCEIRLKQGDTFAW
jgi:hypothetical protein